MSTTSRCYAFGLGGCDSTSREHVVTRSIFGDGPVLTSGLRVPPDTPIGIDSLVASILCKKHNSALSPLDSEIKVLGEACLPGVPEAGAVFASEGEWAIDREMATETRHWKHCVRMD